MATNLIRILSLAAILAILAVAFAAFNATNNPASPIDPPEFSFSSGSTGLTQTQIDATNALADQALSSMTTEYGKLYVEADLKTGKLIHEGLGPLTYVISSGFKCFGNLSMWFFGQPGYDPEVKHEAETNGPCTPEKVDKMLSDFVRKGIEAGVALETMNEVRSFIQQSIWTKFGWALP